MWKVFSDPTYGRRNRLLAAVITVCAIALAVAVWLTIGVEVAVFVLGGAVAFVALGPYVRSVLVNPHAAFWVGPETEHRPKERDR